MEATRILILAGLAAMSCAGPLDAPSAVATSDTGAPSPSPTDTGRTQDTATIPLDSTFEVALRVVHGVPGADPVDLCIAPSTDAAFEGPLIGDEGLGFREGAARQTLTVSPTAQLRWVDATLGDCSTPLGLVADAPLGARQAGPHTALLLAPFAADAPTLATTVVLDDRTVAEPEDGRFYVRFFHGAPSVPAVSVKQGSCDVPFAAFESVPYGELGFSPNNQAPWFSASVTIGSDRFVSDVVVCDGFDEVTRLVQHPLIGGEIQLHLLTGDGSAEAPHGITMCIDTASAPEPCVQLL